MSDIFNLSDTWNSAPTTFTAIKMNVTDTASAAASLVFDYQIGAVSKLSFRKDGYLIFGANGASISAFSGEACIGSTSSYTTRFMISGVSAKDGINVNAAGQFSWASAGGATNAPDTGLARNAAGVVEANNGTVGTIRDIKVRQVLITPVAVASLVAAATAGNGARAHVTDALAPTFGATVAGGGAVSTPVYSDGSNWKVG